ncbi:SpoIIE family protein phosphatase [Kitasatospora sp. NPDC094015]|uniref:SpoIIE family protein phosphatase n=1 Tax=Kitasatospora sp. NPDC094015 TaxID=3155205 RepID=UPI00332B8601
MGQPEGVEYEPPAAAGADVFGGDHEVGRDLAAVDWAATALGAPAGWPQSLRTAVSILLSSRFPMWMAWGEDLTFFCNAAYRRVTLGRKYPWALGRRASEVWAEIWDDIGPRIGTVLATGRATWDEALLLFVERSGYPEESYHTFSYSPLRDDDGLVVGMLCVVSEETERVIGERRMATLRDLGSDPSAVRTEEETLAFATRRFAQNPYDLPFVLTYLAQPDGSARLAAATGLPAGHPAAPVLLPPGGPAGGWPSAYAARAESELVALDGHAFADLPTFGRPAAPTHALVVPLLRRGDVPAGFLVAALNRYRAPDESYRGFVELAAGHVAAGIAGARSYRAQQRRADELAELDRAKTAFFSNVSHEFRTPLTLIMGPLDELRTRLSDADPRTREELDVIHRNGLRLGRLVNTLLDFSRIEAGRMQASFEPVELAAATAELASVFRSAVDRAGLAFTMDCPPLADPVHIDRGMWEKIVLNLLSNALKFTFDGSIGVSVHREDDHAVVTITDTGTGVPATELPRLFERFHRIENARSRSDEGSGIGLALVHELVRAHGGTITARSREGEGTAFTIRLPFGTAHLPPDAVAPAPAAPTRPSTAADPYLEEALRRLPRTEAAAPAPSTDMPDGAASPGGRSAQPPARILVADDNADMREYLGRLLSDPGYRVRTVADGLTALAAIRADAPDLVVSDVMMPGLDGLQLVAALRADPRTAAVPVVLLSARAGQEASIEGLDAGADDYLVKPFTAAELLARVRTTIDMTRLRNRHMQWRTALVDSLQDGFFVCDEHGDVIEINAAFTAILGHGPENLPYRHPQPWWPERTTDPEAHRLVADALAELVGREHGSCTIPVTHRDGHQVWVAATFNRVQEPESGRRVVVGTVRDVTAERHAARRAAALASFGLRLAEAVSLPDALTAAMAELRRLWRAGTVLAVLFPSHGAPVLTSTDPDQDWDRLPAEQREAFTALRTHPALSPVTDRADGIGIVLEHPGGPLVLWIGRQEQRPFGEPDRLLLSQLAGRLTQGLVRAHQIDQQRETALTLQRAILGPSHLPEGFAVRYEPATRPLEVGGDWYDVVALPDGRTGIVVGDCVGRGLTAATVMGQLRSACRALLLQDTSPARVLAAMDRFAADIPGAMCTTVFCAVLDPADGSLTYSSAGHPPGILTHGDGTTVLLQDGRALPLAVRTGEDRPEARCTMPPRSTLLLYTDGLVERRRRPLSEGIDRAGAALREGRALPVDELAARVMADLASDGGYDDDVAILLHRHPAPLEVVFRAESGQLAPVRDRLRGWLNRCGLPTPTVQNVLVAAGEACANAIEHGHRDAPGARVRLYATVTAVELQLTVTDTGNWKIPGHRDDTDRGRGVALMNALMQKVTITPGSTGTTVDMQLRIVR